MPSPLADPVKLPCGVVFPNRLSKAAMAELLADSNHNPSPELIEVYKQWGEGGWGSVLTGNVQVDINHLGTPMDPSIVNEYTGKLQNATLVDTWRKYADACQEHGTPAIVQICHPGRQSARFAGKRGLCAPTIAPSALQLQTGEGYLHWLISKIAFPAPREMTRKDIEEITRKFVDATRLMADSGFSGVELHGAHGYLLGMIMNTRDSSQSGGTDNEKTNIRTDEYGGSAEKRAKFVLDIVAEIRKVVPSSFCVGIKLNSADHSSASFEDTMTQIGLLAEAGIDFLEVSGGSYEDPRMMLGTEEQPTKSARTAAREAFFLEFATEVRKRYPGLILMLTGGFRTRAGAEYAIKQNACDLIGVGRPSAINAKFPQLLLDESIPDGEAGLPLEKVKAPWFASWIPAKGLFAGLETSYYAGQIKKLALKLATAVPS